MHSKTACVPLDTFALSKTGWKNYENLNIGDEILTYNISGDFLEWNEILNLNFYSNVQTYKYVIPDKQIDITCTNDHKWVLRFENPLYPNYLIESNQIDDQVVIRTHASIKNDFNNEIIFESTEDMTVNILNSSFKEILSFFNKNMKYFTYKDPLHLQGKFIFLHDPLNQQLYDTIEICATLLGYRIYKTNKLHESGKYICSFLKSNGQSLRNLNSLSDSTCEVWCPETSNNTWIMKQNEIITITGNSSK